MIVKGGEKTKSKYLAVILILLFILSVNVVSASDDLSDNATVGSADEDILSASEGNFTNLNNQINNTAYGATLDLYENFTYDPNTDSAFVDGILINKSITIIGHGNIVINGLNEAKIFTINSTVVLDNIKFVNSNGAILVTGYADNCVVNNSYFENNTNYDLPGGAIYWGGINGIVVNSKFTRNSVDYGTTGSYDDERFDRGGAIFWAADNGNITNCIFSDNVAGNGAAISFGYYYDGENGIEYVFNKNGFISNCNFTNNNAVFRAGAIDSCCEGLTVLLCNFTNNSATHAGALRLNINSDNSFVSQCIFENNKGIFSEDGYSSPGALEVMASKATVTYCNFTNNSASHAGALKVHLEAHDSIVSYCNFINNNATVFGGAIEWSVGNGKLLNSNFTDNHAVEYGGAIMWSGENGNVSDCNFTNNSAEWCSGAIQWDGDNGNVSDCNFTNNHADVYNGAIGWTGGSGKVTDSYFFNNTANSFGGAIGWDGESGNIGNCNFTNNSAEVHSGAIYFETEDKIVNDCNFVNNSATADDGYGGAIYAASDGCNIAINNCNFTNNSAGEYGGAIACDGENMNIAYCDFTNNSAGEHAGAVWFYDAGSISDCNFTNNSANKGGAIHSEWDIHIDNCNFTINTANEGGAIYKTDDGGLVEITNCIFDSNIANETNGGALAYFSDCPLHIAGSKFNNNSANLNGGAIYCESKDDMEITGSNFTGNNASCVGGAAYLSVLDDGDIQTSISGCRFEDNLAEFAAGALCIVCGDSGSHHAGIDDSYFNGNNATWASAIWLHSEATLSIENTAFGRNRANSSELIIDVIDPVSYYPGNVTVNITFKAKDNIANAIWNGGDIDWDDFSMDYELTSGDVNHISLKAVTFERYRNGELKNITTPDSSINPKDGVENAVDENDIWQDAREDSQLIDILIIPLSEDSEEIQDDFLSASVNDEDALGEPLEDIEGAFTGMYGNITVPLQNLAAGQYKVYAKHIGDKYYTKIGSDNTFEVIDALNVTKTPIKHECDVGDWVDFSILINNTGDKSIGNISVIEDVPEGFDSEIWVNYWSDNYDKWEQEGHVFNYTDVLGPHEWTYLNITMIAIKNGTYTNSISISSNITNSIIVESDEIRIYAPNYTINKTALTPIVFVGDKAAFLINMTNTGDRPLDPYENEKDYIIVDEYPDDDLKYDGYENVTGLWWEFYQEIHMPDLEPVPSEYPSFALVTRLEVNESAVFIVYFNTTEIGTFENLVAIGEDLSSSDVVTVLPEMVKHVNDTEIDVNQSVEYSISINNTGNVALSEVHISDVLNESFVLDESSITYDSVSTFSDAPSVSVEHSYENGVLTFDIDEIPALTNVTLTFSVKITKRCNYTNVANVSVTLDDSHVSDFPIESEVTRVYELSMTVNKTVDLKEIDVDGSVVYTVFVNNTGDRELSNVIVYDELNESFSEPSDISEGWSYDNGAFTYNDNIGVGGNATLSFTVSIYDTGNYTNVVNVTADGLDNVTAESEVTRVYSPSINMTKTAVNSTVFIGHQAVFIINVTNDGDRPLTPDDGISINEWFIDELVYDHIEGISGEWYVNDEEEVLFVLNSTININESASFKIFFNTTKLGEYENIISNSLNPGTASDTVNVIAIPTETVVGNVSGHPRDNVTIPVNVTAADGVPFNGKVNVTLPDGNVELVTIVNGSGSVNWTIPDGYEGQYPTNASFAGNYTHLPSNGTGYVNVEKIPTHISVANITAYPGENVVIPVNVTLDDGAIFNGPVNVTMPDGSKTTINIVNGTGNITWTIPVDYDPEYSENVSYGGDGRYLPSYGIGTITVVKIPTETVVGNVSGHPRDNVTIPVNVTAAEGVPFNGEVNVTLPDGNVELVTIVNGSGSVNWTIPDGYEGQYPTNASFAGNNTHLDSNGTGHVDVEKIPTHISVENITAHPGDNVTIPVNVTADDEVPFNGNITVVLPDGSNQTVVIVNGTGNATWTVPDDYAGNYSVNASYPGDGRYLPSNGTGNIEVIPKVPTEITVDNVTAHPGDDVVIPVNVTTGDNSTFNGNISVTLPDNTTVPVEIVNGSGSVNWTVPDDFDEGDYPVNATFDGDGYYLPSNGTGIVNVTLIPTHISVGNVTAHPGDDVVIPVNVTADDEVPFNGNITVVLPDGSNQTVVVVNGSGSVNWTVPVENVSQYNDTASFPGNNKYLPSNGTGIISVILIDVQLNITVDKSTVYYGDVVEFTVTVRNNGPGNATEVTVTNLIPEEFEYVSDNCSDVNYQSTKDLLMASGATQSYDPSTGIWYIGDLASGEETKLRILAHANFIGTKQVNSSVSIAEIETNYTNNNDTADVTVIQVPTHIDVDNVTAYPGDNITIPIKVTADDDVPFNGNITVILPDGSNQTVEIVNGSGNVDWTVPDDFKEGNYPVNATFDGNDRYLPSNGAGVVTVGKVPTEITVGNVTAKPGEEVTIPIRVTAKDGSQFNGNVTVKLPDGSTKVVEIINGTGTVNWTVPNDYDGKFPVLVSFDGDNYYLPSNGTGFITVIPDSPNPENPSVPEHPAITTKATGNPLMVLLVVLALLGINTRRKK